ncbi:DNA repair protein RAD51-like protein 3-like isoform X10 [Hibiscus syriacus]|uniref:DNA repair protein RAD51-like protein 3-like isoform X10 n=1 Tax=Hibiscus syriacus TaxID=106335 RepID=A0A6A2XSG5_HIBSY|nr:DNA repair protein RAD51-like protein 3-like isoform X10 [Hibiscus syriacus]
MEVLRLPISASQREANLRWLHFLSSLASISSSDLARGAQSAWDMLHEEESLVHITTSSADLDNIWVVEYIAKKSLKLVGFTSSVGQFVHSIIFTVGGVPGIGKTQLG